MRLRQSGRSAALGTGYRLRTGVFEVLTMTDRLRDLVAEGVDMDRILQALKATGHQTLIDHGLEKVRQGATTIEEVAALERGL